MEGWEAINLLYSQNNQIDDKILELAGTPYPNTENPRVGGSISPLGIKEFKGLRGFPGNPILFVLHGCYAFSKNRLFPTLLSQCFDKNKP